MFTQKAIDIVEQKLFSDILDSEEDLFDEYEEAALHLETDYLREELEGDDD